MFAQHTIDVCSTRTKLDREDWSKESWRLVAATGRPEQMLPAETGSEHIQMTRGGGGKKTTLIITNQIKCRITI